MIDELSVKARIERAIGDVTSGSAYRGDEYLSTAGYAFRTEDRRWPLSKERALPVWRVRELLDELSVQGFVGAMSQVARTKSAHHAGAIFDRFLHMLRATRSSRISSATLINYRASLDRRTEWYLGTIRGFLYTWHDLGYPGIGEDVVDLLKSWTLRGNIKGDAVQRLDPTQGPLTDNELVAFNEGAARSFERGLITVSDLALTLLMSHTGRRSRQIAYLKICDLDGLHRNTKGEEAYLINVPRVKQRGGVFRDSFKTFSATRELWIVVNAQRKAVVKSVERIVGCKLHVAERQQLPLFPDLQTFRDIASVGELRSLLDSDRLHIVPSEINSVLKKVVETARCYSERTGELLEVQSRRFRYTMGTRAAREGLGEMIIAELLDQSDTQNAGVYIKNIPEHLVALDAAVGRQLARYAQAFQGVLVDSEEDAVRGGDLTSRIRHRGAAAATCGKHGFCGAGVPVPCYTCMHFQPWLDGPHELIYADLLAERNRILEVTKDPTMAAVNDRSIVAVADVIERCRLRREELAKGSAI